VRLGLQGQLPRMLGSPGTEIERQGGWVWFILNLRVSSGARTVPQRRAGEVGTGLSCSGANVDSQLTATGNAAGALERSNPDSSDVTLELRRTDPDSAGRAALGMAFRRSAVRTTNRMAAIAVSSVCTASRRFR
jgi:hypothetical protein